MATAHPAQASFDNISGIFAELATKAASTRISNLNYGGEISPTETYQFLKAESGVLVDVRTTPEWQFTGVADLSQTRGKMLTLSWKTYPAFMQNPQFALSLSQQPDITKDTPLFFICRSGGRSLDAAIAMTEAGYRHCFNVSGGFEGEPDENGHRGTRESWKAAKLPWKQG